MATTTLAVEATRGHLVVVPAMTPRTMAVTRVNSNSIRDYTNRFMVLHIPQKVLSYRTVEILWVSGAGHFLMIPCLIFFSRLENVIKDIQVKHRPCILPR